MGTIQSIVLGETAANPRYSANGASSSPNSPDQADGSLDQSAFSDSAGTNEGFKGTVQFAHPSVQKAFIIVQRIAKEWDDRGSRDHRKEDQSLKEIETLLRRIGQSAAGMDDTREKQIFRTLVAAIIYAHAIRYSHEKDLNDLCIDPRSESVVTMLYINRCAKRALSALCNSLPSGVSLKQIQGSLARLKSEGNIPFFKVLSNERKVVSLRRGIELQKSHNPETKKIQGPDHRLLDLPCRVYYNGVIQTGHNTSETLADVFEDREYADRLLTNKYVTWIHKSLPDHVSTQTLYEIDFMDHEIESDPVETFIPKKKLEAFVGRSRYGWQTKHRTWNPEDLLVSFLSNILFDHSDQLGNNTKASEGKAPSNKFFWQAMENWSKRRIKEYTTRGKRSKSYPMYIGFSFSTILDGGYADQGVVNCSTNLLLLALCRGMVHLLSNNTQIIGFVDFEASTSSRTGLKLCQRHTAKNPMFIGANPSGITVKTAKPWVLYMLAGSAVILFAVYAILVGNGRNPKEQYWSSLFTTFSFLTGLVLFFSKCYYKRWELAGMIYHSRHSKRMSELSAVLPNGKSDAIEVFGSIDNPEGVFSEWRSCAFAEEGKGEFEIDEEIKVHDLEAAGFTFGVDYYGNPVMANGRGIVRKIFFPRGFRTAREKKGDGWMLDFQSTSGFPPDAEPLLHVGKKHRLTFELMFQLPVRNLVVGTQVDPNDIV